MNDAEGGLFTGERLIAGDRLFAADLARHLAAYHFAREQARGKRVLDAGCGDGYGTNLLAETAGRALGVDRSVETIAIAAERYPRPNLEYRVCELDRLNELGEQFELICNFQVIEHLEDPAPFLKAARNALAPGGALIITTPNRRMSFIENPYHVHEYLAEELREVLSRFFDQVEIRGISGDAQVMAYEQARVANAQRLLRLDPLQLRRFIPGGIIRAVYPVLARVVRRRIASSEADVFRISPESFSISDQCDGALDLLGVCRRKA